MRRDVSTPGRCGPASRAAARLAVRLPALLPGLLLLAAAAAAAQQGSTYRIGPKDLLEISVFEVPELNGSRRVSEQGTISFPPAGDIGVQGMTAVELEQHLKGLLEEKYFRRATVGVQVKEFRSKPISVLGAVNNPGDLAFSGRWTLLEAITAAGGLQPAHGPLIYVLRRAENGLSDQVEISVDDLLVRGDPDVNIPIFANDLINVSATIRITVYLLGEVGQAGAQEFDSTGRVTLLTALARAGGLTDRASPKVVIKRPNPSRGVDDEIVVDYRRVVDGKEVDPKLADGDLIIVKESFF